MRSLLGSTIGRWLTVAVLVVAASGGGAYVVYARVSGSGQDSLGKDRQLVPVSRGALVNQVSTSGSLVFASRATLTFGSQGTVDNVLVQEGQQVKKGQVLASLDKATIASLEKAVAQAKVSVRNAQDALDQAQAPRSALELAQAEAAVATARLNLQKAQKARDELAAGPDADVLARAYSQIDSTKVSLDNARRDLELQQTQWDATLQAKRDHLQEAADGYRTVFRRFLGMDLTDAQLLHDPDSLLKEWGADLDALFGSAQRFQDLAQGYWAAGVPPDDPMTPWNETTVYGWVNLFPGKLVPGTGGETSAAQVVSVKGDVDAAWEALKAARDDLSTAELQAAKALASGESGVKRAEEALEEAQTALADLQQEPDPLELDVKEKQVVVSQASLDQALENLAKLQTDPDPLDMALAQTQLDSAQADLERAEERLALAVLQAPMAGVISAVGVEAGQAVNASTAIVEIVDPTIVEIDGVVDEVDVLFVREGARADVTMDALRGSVLAGTVSTIASGARSQQGVVSYPISILVQVPEGVQLREGLSATASIVIREERDVILVPIQALYGSFEQPVVRVMNNGRVEDRSVVLGNSDDYWVAVRQGLGEGEQVVMETQQATTGQFGMGQVFRMQGQGIVPGLPGTGGTRQSTGGSSSQRTPVPQRQDH
ncbi:MAG: efflux RND transporter periplasmic adaptor subunit [Chloroflexi bacterium]|nr:efflux RND transporter periplasmic adaptor subunit [Chloroflexota bacterium]